MLGFPDWAASYDDYFVNLMKIQYELFHCGRSVKETVHSFLVFYFLTSASVI